MNLLRVISFLFTVVLTTALCAQFPSNTLSESIFPNNKPESASKRSGNQWSLITPSDWPVNKPVYPSTSYSLLQRSPAERLPQVTNHATLKPKQLPIRPVRFEYLESDDEPRQILPSVPTTNLAPVPNEEPPADDEDLFEEEVPGLYQCDGCGCANNPCRPGLVPYSGIESTFLFPILAASSTFVETVSPLETVMVNQNDATLDGSVFVSPRTWLGLQYGLWGVEARFFSFNASEISFAPQTPLVPRNLSAFERIQAWNADIEIFKKWCNHCGDDRRLSLGFRYVKFDAANEVTMDYVLDTPGAGSEFALASATAMREVQGPGITFALEGAHLTDFSACRKNRCDSLKWFWGLRGAVIFAEVLKTAHSDAIVFDSFNSASAASINTAVSDGDDVAFNAEVKFGLHYERPLKRSCAKFFCRAGVEYQFWGVDGGIAAVGSLAFTNNVTITSGATADDTTLHLVGASVSTGLMW